MTMPKNLTPAEVDAWCAHRRETERQRHIRRGDGGREVARLRERARAADPEWCARRLETGRKRAADPEWCARRLERNRGWRLTRSPEWRAKNTARGRFLASGYTAEDYNRMVAEQNGLCNICDQTNANGKALDADHCHVTGITRRPLCHMCNLGLSHALDQPWILEMAGPKILAYFRHDRELIKRAIDYIYNFRMAAAVPILCGVPRYAA
jgi:hypothetical protein